MAGLEGFSSKPWLLISKCHELLAGEGRDSYWLIFLGDITRVNGFILQLITGGPHLVVHGLSLITPKHIWRIGEFNQYHHPPGCCHWGRLTDCPQSGPSCSKYFLANTFWAFWQHQNRREFIYRLNAAKKAPKICWEINGVFCGSLGKPINLSMVQRQCCESSASHLDGCCRKALVVRTRRVFWN